jgi:integrase
VNNRDAVLFTAPDGGLLRYSNWLRRVWYPATAAAGLGRFVENEATGRKRYVGLGFHDLRRANATGLVAEGVDTKTAQALLGHSNAQLTLGLYAQAVVSLGAAAAESMAARLQLPGSDKPHRAAWHALLPISSAHRWQDVGSPVWRPSGSTPEVAPLP